jgi:hypothetical protein
MIQPLIVSERKRKELEKIFKAEYPSLRLEYSPSFRHYYIKDPKTKETSDNISAFELYHRLINPFTLPKK